MEEWVSSRGVRIPWVIQENCGNSTTSPVRLLRNFRLETSFVGTGRFSWNQTIRSAVTAFARTAAIPYYQRRLRRFEAVLKRAHSVQRASLFEKLHRCAETRFGRDHGFSKIATIDDFRRRVPISGYEYAAPYITDVSEGRLDALFPAGEEVLAFACTTGTTGKPKLNPVTRTWMREFLRACEVWGVKAITDHSEMIGTMILQLTGPGNLGRSPSGLSIGMASAIATKYQNPVYRSFYAVPPVTADIIDPVAKYYTTMRFAMASRVGLAIAITPASLIRVAELGHDYRERLIRDIHDGTLDRTLDLPSELRRTFEKSLRVRRPDRARELEQIVERTGTLYPKDYWPLSLVACWLGGTIGYQARELPRFYGAAPLRDLGLISTEGRHTIPLHDGRGGGVLAVDGSYFEFLPVEDRGSPNPRVLECHELQPGSQYHLIVTTSSGLYRYDLGDIVRCEGCVGEAPVLEFLQKAGQCSDMEGEKISGSQIVEAVDVASRELSLRLDCFMAVPVRRDGSVPYYALLVERAALEDSSVARQFIRLVDRELIRQNVMYSGKRNDRYIDAPQVVRLANGTWASYMATEICRTGTGDSQYKHPALVPDTSTLDRFQPLDTVTL
jgi:GH3 auxin-responsive promoter